jgi:lysophospholipase L1-like esterase
VDVWYVQNPGYGLLQLSSGGALGALINCDGVRSIVRVTRTKPLGLDTLALTKSGTGAHAIVGLSFYNSTQKAIEVWNAGWGGSTSTVWNAAAQVWEPAAMLATYAVDLTVICLTINDWIGAVSGATHTTNLDVLIAAAKTSGDVILMTGAPTLIATASQANQDAILQAQRALAVKHNVPLIDISARWGSQIAAADPLNGYFDVTNDGVHPGVLGNADIAQAVFSVVVNP